MSGAEPRLCGVLWGSGTHHGLCVLAGNHGKKIAVIENEFGEVGIDDALVLDTREEIFEMNNGCVCCTGAWAAAAPGWLQGLP